MILTKKSFDVYKAINELLRNIKEWPKKTLINKISKILLVLQLKSVKVLKLKDIKYITKKILLGYKEYSCGEIYSPW